MSSSEPQRAPQARPHRLTRRRFSQLLLLTAATSHAVAGYAADTTPFNSFNQSPLVQIYGLPAIGDSRVLKAGQDRMQLSFAIANNFTGGMTANESLILDGESYRTTLALAGGIGRDMEIGAELPYVSQSGGFLDRYIDGFHDLFGLPDGGRRQVARNRLLYYYQRNGQTLLDMTQAASGIGDIRLTGARQLQTASTPGTWDVALRTNVKLPTGNSDRLLGSGSTDVALWLSAACSTGCSGSLGWYGGGGLLHVGDGDVLSQQQLHWVGFGSIGVAWPWKTDVTLKAQIDAHTPFYEDSGLRQLNANSFELLLGGSWSLQETSTLDFAFAEDVGVNTAPDVTFFITWRRRR